MDLDTAVRTELPPWQGHGVGLLPKTKPADKMRLALTAACNFSCYFCHNEGSVPQGLGSETALSPGDFAFVAATAANAGIVALKLTGGEPLVYRHGDLDVTSVVKGIIDATSSSPLEVSMTTNGQLLPRFAGALCEAGLRHVTVSVHTLDIATFRDQISLSGSPMGQLRGLSEAVKNGLRAKANVVVTPGATSGIPALVQKLVMTGAHEVRLYQRLWSPLSSHAPNVPEPALSTLLDLASQVTGTPIPADFRALVAEELSGPRLPSGRSIAVGTRESRVVLDLLAPSGTGESSQEGNYAIRMSSDGGLHAHLFGDKNDVLRLIRGRKFEKLGRQITVCREAMSR